MAAPTGLQLNSLLNQRQHTEPVGNDLLSQRATPPVPSALANLTSGFEMDPGVPSPLLSPTSSVWCRWF